MKWKGSAYVRSFQLRSRSLWWVSNMLPKVHQCLRFILGQTLSIYRCERNWFLSYLTSLHWMLCCHIRPKWIFEPVFGLTRKAGLLLKHPLLYTLLIQTFERKIFTKSMQIISILLFWAAVQIRQYTNSFLENSSQKTLFSTEMEKYAIFCF